MTNVEKLQSIKPSSIYDDIAEKIKWDNGLSEEEAQSVINEMDAEDIVETWLHWNGISGFTAPIIRLVRTLYEAKD